MTMKVDELKGVIPEILLEVLKKEKVSKLRPCQEKALRKGLLNRRNMVVCTPTASGKTLVSEIAFVKNIVEGRGKALYIVPLKALANEKYNDFKKRYGQYFKIALSIGDLDSADSYLSEYDVVICTAEKLDSLIRHHAQWLRNVATVVIDEIHLLNDTERGPRLEIITTILKQTVPNAQFIGLSATIGNPEELAGWLNAEVIKDNWRPVKLKQGIYLNGEVEFK